MVKINFDLLTFAVAPVGYFQLRVFAFCSLKFTPGQKSSSIRRTEWFLRRTCAVQTAFSVFVLVHSQKLEEINECCRNAIPIWNWLCDPLPVGRDMNITQNWKENFVFFAYSSNRWFLLSGAIQLPLWNGSGCDSAVTYTESAITIRKSPNLLQPLWSGKQRFGVFRAKLMMAEAFLTTKMWQQWKRLFY